MIIDDIRINQNYGKKKSSFRPRTDLEWKYYEEKIIGPEDFEHLPGNIVNVATVWLGLAAQHGWEFYDKDGNAKDLKKIGKEYMEFIQAYFKV